MTTTTQTLEVIGLTSHAREVAFRLVEVGLSSDDQLNKRERISEKSIPEAKEKRKSIRETLSVFSASSQLSYADREGLIETSQLARNDRPDQAYQNPENADYHHYSPDHHKQAFK